MTGGVLSKADLLQQQAADPMVNVWVAASAGSGKTKVLTDRVLSLLLSGTSPEKLLCITFTKSAAAEMANRIHERLAKWTILSDAELAAEVVRLDGREADDTRMTLARRLFARVLDAPGGLKIQTVHGFCQSVLRRFPIEAGISPHFEVLDERSAGELMMSSRDAVLRAAEGPGIDQDALYAVTRRVAEDQFATLLNRLSASRGRLKEYLDAHGVEGAVARVHAVLGSEPGVGEDDVIRDACAADAADDLGLRMAAEAMFAHGSDANRARAAEILSWLEMGTEERIAGFGTYQKIFLTTDFAPRKTVAVKAVLEAVPSVATVLAAEQERLVQVDARFRRQATGEANAGLLRLGAAILTRFEATKRALARLDYDDLILLTRDLLDSVGAPWVLYKLDGGLDHLLIDEAQDTSPDQWRIVAALADTFFEAEGLAGPPRTIFAVGDVKQSIYSFQGADPEGFRNWRDYFARRAKMGPVDLRPVPMDMSFRSVDPILRAVDSVFSLDASMDGVVDPGAVLRHEAFRTGQNGRVELWPMVEPPDKEDEEAWALPDAAPGLSDDDPLTVFASGLAGRIAAIIGGDILSARARRVRAGDILVLVRRRSALVDALVRALKDRAVPVAGVDRMVLTEQIAVMDLVALGHVLLMPDDDLQLACVLKGPFIGFDDADLFRLAHGRGRQTLWSRLRDAGRRDSRIAAAVEWLAGLMANADYLRPFELFQRVLGDRCPVDYGFGSVSGWQAMVARLGAEAEEPVTEFLSLALTHERVRIPSLQGFLAWFARGRSEIKRDLEAKSRDEVRIMTVHGAKGLQAPVVILPDTARVPQDAGGPEFYWRDAADDAPMPIWTPAKRFRTPVGQDLLATAKLAREREYRRLLYVAMTRAEDRLIVCGYRGARKPDAGCWYDMVREGLEASGAAQTVPFDVSESWRGDALVLEGEQSAPPRTESEKGSDASGAPPPDWLRRAPPPEPEPPRPLVPSRPVLDDPPVRSPLGDPDGQRFVRGRLVHRLLQTLPDLPESRRRGAAERFLAQSGHGLDADARVEIADETLAILDAPELSDLFGPGSRAEVPITGLATQQHEPGGLDGNVPIVSGQVDRLAVTDDAVIVADYKTQRPAPSEVGRIPTAYIAQMARYRDLLRRIFPDRPVRCVLVWTESARPMTVPDSLMDQVQAGT